MATKDKTSPKLISINPIKGSYAVDIKQNLVLKFNEDIKIGTGTITISNGAADTRPIYVNSSSNQISINGGILTINPTNDLLANSHYTVKIDNTALQDLSGNPYVGIKNTTTFYFDTVDTIAPILTKSSPSANLSNVLSNSNIILTFNEKIKVGSGNITLVSGSDTRLIAITDKQIKISGNTLTLNPTIDLNTGSSYKIHLDTGAIKDLAPVANSNNEIDFSFTTKTTGDKQAPILQNYANKGIVTDNLLLTFQEAIKVGKGNFTLSDGTKNILIPVTDTSQVSIENNVLTINPKENLNPEKIYTLIAPKAIVTDLSKNAFAGLTSKAPFTYDTHIKSSNTSTSNGTSNGTSNNTDLIVKSNGSSDATKGTNLYNISAGNYTYTINGFSTDDKLKFFTDASLNVIPDVNQQDGVQEIDAIDRASGSTTVIFLSGLTSVQDDSIFNLPSFFSIFPNGIVH